MSAVRRRAEWGRVGRRGQTQKSHRAQDLYVADGPSKQTYRDNDSGVHGANSNTSISVCRKGNAVLLYHQVQLAGENWSSLFCRTQLNYITVLLLGGSWYYSRVSLCHCSVSPAQPVRFLPQPYAVLKA